MLLIILISICSALVYFALIKPHKYWKKLGVVHEKPCPLFGSLVPILTQKQSMAELLQDIYNKHPNERLVGFYQFLTPTVILRDPDLIRKVAVKEFDSFPEHTMFASEEADPLWAKNLFAMPGGDEWRDVRAILSPAFTSSKLRTMLGLIIESAKQFTDHFVNQNHLGTIEVELKDAFTKVTNDIIATTAFGVSCDSTKDPNNEIFLMGKDASDVGGLTKSLKFFVAAISPTLAKLLKIRFISAETTAFFRRIIRETITVREEKGIVRPDMIHLMMEAKKGRLRREENEAPDSGYAVVQETELKKNLKHKTIITDDVITAQTVVFFLAGFDTVSTAMSYTAYELALNPHIQTKLAEEVDETIKKCGREVTYEGLMGMKYLDMVITEVLRKWPPFAVTDRKTTKTTMLEPRHPHEKPLVIERGVVCQIPIYSLHRDPDYYPEPDKFDPERFTDENKHKIKPFTYLPFGVGPRNCIGSRFALLEVKIVIFYILVQFEIVPVKKTQVPLVLSKSNVNPIPDEGFWLGLKPRVRKNVL